MVRSAYGLCFPAFLRKPRCWRSIKNPVNRSITWGNPVRSISLIFLAFISTMFMGSSASASDMEKVMQLWCSQVGTWTGMIDITAADGETRRDELVTIHDCTEASSFHIVRERFGSGPSTVKVTFIDKATQNFHTEYFVNGKSSPYEFSFVSVEATDETHWKTVIESTPGSEKYEGRPAILRYIRVRNGDTIESWKDVQFEDGQMKFEPRSKIVQTLRR